jgi:Flp pilus assembly protein TadG
MVEFAMVAPLVFLLLIGSMDFMRLISANTIVADAARQGARQAVANADWSDQAWAASNGLPCSGTVFTGSASGQGCLTDARIKETVARVLLPLATTVTLYANTAANLCPVPAAGQANLCLQPAETGTAAGYNNCGAAKTALGHDAQPGDLGARYPEYITPKFKGCFLVQVTVVYKFQPTTPYGPSIKLTGSTSMLAEY